MSHRPPLPLEDDVDPGRFDAAVEALPSLDRLLPSLLDTVGADLRVAAEACFPRGAHRYFEVRRVYALGRPGLWLATEHLLGRLPTIRGAPEPTHERWDALMEIHRALPEAPWLLAQLLASLREGQEAVARRALLGVDRRFGPRGRRAIERALGEGAELADYVRRRLEPPNRD